MSVALEALPALTFTVCTTCAPPGVVPIDTSNAAMPEIASAMGGHCTVSAPQLPRMAGGRLWFSAGTKKGARSACDDALLRSSAGTNVAIQATGGTGPAMSTPSASCAAVALADKAGLDASATMGAGEAKNEQRPARLQARTCST